MISTRRFSSLKFSRNRTSESWPSTSSTKVHSNLTSAVFFYGILTWSQVLDARRQAQMDAAQSEQLADQSPQGDRSFFTENARGKPRQQRRPGKLTMAERKELERQRQEEFELAFSKLDLLQPALEANDPVATQEWLDVASFLVDGFRETKELFPSDFVGPFLLSGTSV
jgi:hypothetical protein